MYNKIILVAFFVAFTAAAPLAPNSHEVEGNLPSLGDGSTPSRTIPYNVGSDLSTDLPGSGENEIVKRQFTNPFLSLPTGLFGGLGSATGSGASAALPTGLGTTSGTTSGSSALSGLSGLTGSSDTSNGASGACMPITLLFARGTTETGNLGTVVGPGLAAAVQSGEGASNVAIQGVDYSASVGGNVAEALGGGDGTTAMVADVNAVLAKCPNTSIVLTGYSQGGMVVHNTLTQIGAAKAKSVKAAVTFGDPFVGQMPANLATGTFKSFCATGDSVCDAGIATSPSVGGTTSQSALGHLGYGSDVGTAATFIKSIVPA